MTSHPIRYYGSGHLHFITCSCYRRQPLLGSAERRDLFLDVLENIRRQYRFVVVGYVVMPEHIHLLISEPQDRNPSTAMQALKLSFARRVLADIHRHSAQATPFDLSRHHVWQKRFHDFNVWSLQKQVEKLNYIHDNPVRRGLVESPEMWRWSSYRTYVLSEVGKVRINRWEVLKLKVHAPVA